MDLIVGNLWLQQRFNPTTLIHRAIALRDLIEWQRQVEHLSGIEFLVQY
jgi:hypothetical protein